MRVRVRMESEGKNDAEGEEPGREAPRTLASSVPSISSTCPLSSLTRSRVSALVEREEERRRMRKYRHNQIILT